MGKACNYGHIQPSHHEVTSIYTAPWRSGWWPLQTGYPPWTLPLPFPPNTPHQGHEPFKLSFESIMWTCFFAFFKRSGGKPIFNKNHEKMRKNAKHFTIKETKNRQTQRKQTKSTLKWQNYPPNMKNARSRRRQGLLLQLYGYIVTHKSIDRPNLPRVFPRKGVSTTRRLGWLISNHLSDTVQPLRWSTGIPKVVLNPPCISLILRAPRAPREGNTPQNRNDNFF